MSFYKNQQLIRWSAVLTSSYTVCHAYKRRSTAVYRPTNLSAELQQTVSPWSLIVTLVQHLFLVFCYPLLSVRVW